MTLSLLCLLASTSTEHKIWYCYGIQVQSGTVCVHTSLLVCLLHNFPVLIEPLPTCPSTEYGISHSVRTCLACFCHLHVVAFTSVVYTVSGQIKECSCWATHYVCPLLPGIASAFSLLSTCHLLPPSLQRKGGV